MELVSKTGIYMRDDIFSTNSGIIVLHPTKGTHPVCYIGKYYFGSYGCAPSKNISNYIKSRYRKCVYSEFQIQKNKSLCGSYCLYFYYSMFLYSMGFKTTLLNLYYNKWQKGKVKPIKRKLYRRRCSCFQIK